MHAATHPGLPLRGPLRLLGALLLAFALGAGARAADVGAPPRVSFERDGEAEGQFYGIERDHRGLVYLGHESGLIEYDGESWLGQAIGGEQLVRSLAASGERLFVGGYNSFGEMQMQPDGRRLFVDLTGSFAEALQGREFADIWGIEVTPQGVYFRALRDLFLWHPEHGAVRHWHHPGRFGAMAHRDGETWLQFRGEGMRRWVGGDWQPVPGSGHLTELIFSLLPLNDGGWLATGVRGDWWRVGPAGIEALSMPEGLPPSSRFQHAERLQDGSLALASGEGTIVIVAADLASFVELRLEQGFLSGVRALPDGMLVAGSRGFHHVTWPSALTVVDASHGLLGSLYGSARWNGIEYLLSSAGVFAARDREGGVRFERIDGPPASSAHDLLPLDAGRALLATSHRLLLLTAEDSVPLSQELVYPRLLQRSAHAGGRIYVGSEDDLRVLAARAGRWVLMPRPTPEAARRVTSIVERSALEVWTGTDRRGVWRHRLDADGSLLESTAVDAGAGLRYGPEQRSIVFELPDGRLGASTAAGLYVLRGERFETLLLGNLGTLREPGELLVPVLSAGGPAWAYSDLRLLFAADAAQWSELPARRLRQGNYSRHSIDEAGGARFLSDRAVLIHRPQQAQAAEPPPQLRLRRVTRIDAAGGRQLMALQLAEPLRLPVGAFALDFRYALADLTRPRDRSYRARLVGHEATFSEWSAADGYTYWGLPAGSYRFEAQARDAEGRISAIAPYALVIEPAWFDRWPARLLWLLLAGLLASMLLRQAVRRRTRRLLAQTRQLESTVAERTLALAEANRRLDEMAHVDGLTGISNRRRLDQYLAAVHAQCVERGRSLGVLAIDADRFKDFNDRHGHPAGDELLRRLVSQMGGCLRRSEDLLGRFGGEEFLAVLPGATPEIALELAERMRAAVEGAALGATVSIGVAAGVPAAGDTPEDLVQRADTALYRAKQGGRNRVAVAAPE